MGDPVPRVAGQVSWPAFDAARFDLGRANREVEVGLISGSDEPGRTLVDAFRLRHPQGEDEVYEALRRPGTQRGILVTMAGHSPWTVPVIG